MTDECKLHSELELLLDDVSHGLESEIDSIKNQVVQIKSLLVDAIGSLHDSFASINQQSSAQMKLFSSLISEIVDAPLVDGQDRNIFQYVEDTEKTLTEMLQILVHDSRESLQAVVEMRSSLKDMNSLANQDRALSELLAHIREETLETSPDLEKIRTLSEDAARLNDKITRDREASSDAFTQARAYIDELASRDMEKVFEAKKKVELILEHLNKTNSMIIGCRVQANSVNADLKQYLGSAIRALQFEDIVSQSLGHTELHIDRMDGFVSRVAKGISDLHAKTDTTDEIYVVELGRLRQEILIYRDSLRLEDVNPVSQESMDEGDVELF